jgi:hypothetical protein
VLGRGGVVVDSAAIAAEYVREGGAGGDTTA